MGKVVKVDGLGKFSIFENELISNQLANNLVWEPHLQAVFEQCVRTGDEVLEGGAFIGVHTIKLAKLCKPGKLYVFEPNPGSFQKLTKNIRLNRLKNVKAYRMGLSDRHGETKFAWISGNNYGSSGLAHNPMGVPTWSDKPAEDIAVKLIDVDSLGLTRLGFMKLDVEGYESKVIVGAVKTIQRCRPLITLECWANHNGTVEDLRNQNSELLNTLRGMGYQIMHILGPDFLAVPKERIRS